MLRHRDARGQAPRPASTNAAGHENVAMRHASRAQAPRAPASCPSPRSSCSTARRRARPIAARREDGAVAFPTFDAVDVDGTAVAFPALLKRRVTLVGVSFRAIGAAQSREWLEPFGRRVYLTYRGMAHTATAHCSLIEQPVFRFTWLRNWLLRDFGRRRRTFP